MVWGHAVPAEENGLLGAEEDLVVCARGSDGGRGGEDVGRGVGLFTARGVLLQEGGKRKGGREGVWEREREEGREGVWEGGREGEGGKRKRGREEWSVTSAVVDANITISTSCFSAIGPKNVRLRPLLNMSTVGEARE